MRIKCSNCFEEFEVKYTFTLEKNSIITQIMMTVSCPYCNQLNEIVFKPISNLDKLKLKNGQKIKPRKNQTYIG